jgi:tetratricopeptide (TPR) repeat protein
MLLVAAPVLAASPAASSAAEPAREFLDKLREKGYYDTALDYLDIMANSPAAPVELKQTLLYEKGTTLIDASRTTRDSAIRAKQLDDAQDNLQKFTAANPNHPLASSAQKQIGNLFVERARIVLERAKKSASAAEMTAANGLYQQAYESFDSTQKGIAKKLEALGPNPPDPKAVELRDTLRIDYLQTQLLAAAIREEMADTVEKDPAKYKETLTAAAKEYGEIYDKYRTRLAGLYARMYQGRCYQKMGDDKEALSYLSELLEEPDSADEVRTLKTKALLLAVKSWAAASQKKYAEAIAKGTDWLSKVRPNETKTSDWLELRLNLARAMQAYAEELKAKDAKQSNGQLAEARKLAKFVADVPGEFQKEARDLLAKLGIGSATPDAIAQPKNFNEAFEAAKEQLDLMRTSQLVLQTVPARLKAEKDAQVQDELKAQLELAKTNVDTAKSESQRLFEAALKLANEETELTRLNLVQYYLCYLSYLQEDYYAAALIGEYVAQRYPESPGARQCAKIAMAAYVKIYSESTDEDKSFESDRVVQICEYITKKWPDHTEAEEALNTLIPFMIQTKQLDKAEAYLTKIPVESPSRGSAELKTGQAMWSAYLRGMQEVRAQETAEEGPPEGVNLAERKKELEDLKTRAQSTLTNGVTRMKESGDTSATFASAMLSLAQIYVDTNQTAKAIEILEDPKVGPLVLVSKNDPSVQREGFAEETLKVALRAYIGSLADGPDNLAKAKAVIEELKKRVGDTEEGKQQLVRIYFGIARDLKSQIELSDSAANRSALSKGFETFLEQVGSEAQEFNLMNWVAETFYGMGEAFDTNKTALTPEAKRYFEKADQQFKRILDKAAKTSGWLDERLAVQIQLRAASCKRKLGDFAGAVAALEAILLKNPMMVNVQVEAAYTYQDWAAAKKSEKEYLHAMRGGETKQTGKFEPVIWGWGLLGNKTANAPAFRDTFFEARYNLALCRYRQAKLQSSSSEQKKLLETSERDIKNVSIVDKTYGGEAWRPKFDTLLKTIQRDLAKKPDGLDAFNTEIKPVSTK